MTRDEFVAAYKGSRVIWTSRTGLAAIEGILLGCIAEESVNVAVITQIWPDGRKIEYGEENPFVMAWPYASRSWWTVLRLH